MREDIRKIDYESVDETLYSYIHKSGLRAFVIPKKGYSKKYATFSTHYGSIDNEFIMPGEKEAYRVPDGVAHFLEHKLFEQKDGSVMNKFSALGSSPNAYTSFNQTVYLFSCTDRFEDNFRLLTDYVQNPWITEESVEKEKGIIGQEIRMYEDDPGWRAYFNLLKAMYVNNPVRIDIAGTVDSISEIDRDVLYKCYNTFYHPSNMAILVVGDVEPESVFNMVDEGIKDAGVMPDITRIYPEEPEKPDKSYIEQSLEVSMPMFNMGFKDKKPEGEGEELLLQEVATKIVMTALFGRSSVFFDGMYGEGLINSSFEWDYSIERNYAFSVIGGESPDPHRLKDEILALIERTGREGLDRQTCMRIKNAMKGRFMRQFNSPERISHTFISVLFKGVNMFDYSGVYDKITFEYMSETFNRHFKPENLVLSVIKPL
ncbi:MAG: insulinase family protein [Clostridiales bacterium]|nr:insulinase family protein [Clostridiales bacterium]